jgi:hypothetical protein
LYHEIPFHVVSQPEIFRPIVDLSAYDDLFSTVRQIAISDLSVAMHDESEPRAATKSGISTAWTAVRNKIKEYEESFTWIKLVGIALLGIFVLGVGYRIIRFANCHHTYRHIRTWRNSDRPNTAVFNPTVQPQVTHATPITETTSVTSNQLLTTPADSMVNRIYPALRYPALRIAREPGAQENASMV